MDDKYYNQKKKANLILTEAHVKKGGSNRSIRPESTLHSCPYTNTDGPDQWDRRLHRYRTYEEQLAYVNYIREHQYK